MSGTAPERVVVAMSGGVDSSVTAALLKRAGKEVIGITLRLYDSPQVVGSRTCCAGRDIGDARRVAERLGIAHYIFDYAERFRENVIDDFADTYLAGATPVPCIRCNERVKFADLLEHARELGATSMATGHYVRRVETSNGVELHRPRDDNRDQTWFLFTTTREQLAFLRFPLGDLEKSEVRALAEEFGLVVADKPDSQDICFVPDGDYAGLIKRLRPEAGQGGEIVDQQGVVLGRHKGLVHYTVGQRRGLGLDRAGKPLYVLKLEPETCRVVVGSREALLAREVPLHGVNWLGEQPIAQVRAMPLSVRLRSSQEPIRAHLTLRTEASEKPALRPSTGATGGTGGIGGIGGILRLDEPTEAVAPGQAAVFYQGTRVLGGGWIAPPASPATKEPILARSETDSSLARAMG